MLSNKRMHLPVIASRFQASDLNVRCCHVISTVSSESHQTTPPETLVWGVRLWEMTPDSSINRVEICRQVKPSQETVVLAFLGCVENPRFSDLARPCRLDASVDFTSAGK